MIWGKIKSLLEKGYSISMRPIQVKGETLATSVQMWKENKRDSAELKNEEEILFCNNLDVMHKQIRRSGDFSE